MAFVANHNRNDRLGQSLLPGCEAPWDSLRLTETVCGRLFLWLPSELCPLGAPSWGGEAHGRATPRVTLQIGTRATHRPACPGCREQESCAVSVDADYCRDLTHAHGRETTRPTYAGLR
jgi:hypothetical protein